MVHEAKLLPQDPVELAAAALTGTLCYTCPMMYPACRSHSHPRSRKPALRTSVLLTLLLTFLDLTGAELTTPATGFSGSGDPDVSGSCMVI